MINNGIKRHALQYLENHHAISSHFTNDENDYSLVVKFGKPENLEQEPMSNNEWHDKGERPPVHENIEWCGKRGGYWVKSRVVDYTDEQICLLHHSDQDYKPHKMEVFNFSDINLRPIRTDRERAIEGALEVVKGKNDNYDCVAALYDAGMLKAPEDK